MNSLTQIKASDRWLQVDFPEDHFVLSWAVVGGGWTISRKILWHRVEQNELTADIDERKYFRDKLVKERKGEDVVGFLTSAPLLDFVEHTQTYSGSWARCMATVGLSNALRIGDPPSLNAHCGTINILLQTSEPLNQASSAEALSLVCEARTLAVLEGGIPSSMTLLAATGTGTDCVAVASPRRAGALSYAGKHTRIGHLIGIAVYNAVAKGVRRWKKKWRSSF